MPCRAIVTSAASFAGVATRVIARTFEYEISPFANVALTSGSFSSARATRTFSRAAKPSDAALPVEPLRGVHETVPLVRLAAVVFADETQEAIRRRVQVAPELGDLGFELDERLLLRGECGGENRMCGGLNVATVASMAASPGA